MNATFADFGIDLSGRRGAEVKTTCPKCSATRKKNKYPCLNVNTEKGVWHCWHCEWSGSLKGNGADDHSIFRSAKYGEPKSRHPYRDADGAISFYAVRFEDAAGKHILQCKPNGTGVVWKGITPPRPLYQLPELLADKAKPVLLIEGEKCADAAAKILPGYAVTTWAGGAKATGTVDLAPLRGRAVTIWPDADKPGRDAAAALVKRLQGIAREVFVLGIDGRPEGWDIADAIAEDWTVNDLTTFIEDHAKSERTLDGADLFDAVYEFLGRFIAYPSPEARVAHALWIAHTHLLDEFESTPRIAFLSPERSSGKTRSIEITETLVPRPILAINVTPAYLFRKIGDPEGRPTILYDEIDTVFGPNAKEHEELRGVLNAGHRRGAIAGRCVVRGKLIETEELPAYCAVAIAGLGELPDTILSRSVIIGMKRRAPTETVEPYRTREHVPEGHALRDELASWAERVRGNLGIPDMPPGITDRDADVWEPLIAIADTAGSDWPQRARVAAVALVALARTGGQSLGIRLLADLRAIFDEPGTSNASLPTKQILTKLVGIEESPWGDLRGKPLDERGLARILKPYGVSSKNLRLGVGVVKGYAREDLHDPWLRYLGPPAIEGATAATSATTI